MAEEDWIKIRVKQPAIDMVAYGPSMQVKLKKVGAAQTVDLIAEIDTGAGHSAISPEAQRRLGADIVGSADVHEINKNPTAIPVCRAVLRFPKGPDLNREFLVLNSLGAPHDVVIGRDILRAGVFSANFVGGFYELHLSLQLLRLSEADRPE